MTQPSFAFFSLPDNCFYDSYGDFPESKIGNIYTSVVLAVWFYFIPGVPRVVGRFYPVVPMLIVPINDHFFRRKMALKAVMISFVLTNETKYVR